MHEQRKAWVPLMLEASYKPTGWLGIMCVPSPCVSQAAHAHAHVRTGVSHRPYHIQPRDTTCAPAQRAHRLGSRLYYDFTTTALVDSVQWERLADSVAVEVQRHGAPAPSSAPASQAFAESVPQNAAGQAGLVDQVVSAAPAPQIPESAAPTPRGALSAAHGAAPGVSVSSVHVRNSNSNSNTTCSPIATNYSVSNSNTGNTSIVLL